MFHPIIVPPIGYDRDGYDRSGFDRYGYDRDGFNAVGFNVTGYNRTGHYDGLGVFGKRGDIDKYVKSMSIFFFKWHAHPCKLTVVNYEGYFDCSVCRVGVNCEGT